MKKRARITAMIFLSVLGSTAFAAVPGAYFGGGLGGSKLETPHQNDSAKPKKLNGLSQRVFAGYNFNEYMSYEIGFAHYATSTYKNSFGLTQASVEDTLNAADLVLKAHLPFGHSGFNLYGLGGVALVHNTLKLSGKNIGAMKGEKTQNKFRPIYGLGASYDIPQTKFSTALELTRIQGKGNMKTNTNAIPTADMLTFNIAYNFD